MTFSIKNLINSLAGALNKIFTDESGAPLYPVYDSPTASTDFPCFFIFPIAPEVIEEVGDRFIRDVDLDIVFVQQRNVSNAYLKLYEMAELMDYSLDQIEYSDGTETGVMLVHDRSWSIEDQELHYKLSIKQRVRYDYKPTYMTLVEATNVTVKEREI